MRMRSALIALPVLASALFAAVMPAGASPAGPGRLAGPPPATVRPLAGPEGHATGRIIEDVFNGDSCTNQPDNPSIKSTCVAIGWFSDASFVEGLLEFSDNGKWFGNSFGSLQTVTNPIEVSCVPQQASIPVCVAVGEHYTNPSFPAQLVATGGDNGFSPIAFSNPRGTTWSVLDDVSCARSTFCMLVGSAGTTRKTSGGLVYLSHATAYRWNGTSLRQLTVPAPARSKGSELGGVSCPTATTCIAVGDYTSSTGRSLPY